MFWLKFVFESIFFDWINLFMFQPREKWSDLMEYIFESYLELDYDKWIIRGCISGECDSFVLGNILLSRQQAGVKMYFYVEV